MQRVIRLRAAIATNKLEPMEHVEYLCLPHGTAPIVGNSVDANNYNTTLSVLCAEPRVSLLLLRLQITSFHTKETTICFGMVSCSPYVHSITTRQSNASNAKAATRSMLSTAMHATCTASRSTRGIQAIRSNEVPGGRKMFGSSRFLDRCAAFDRISCCVSQRSCNLCVT